MTKRNDTSEVVINKFRESNAVIAAGNTVVEATWGFGVQADLLMLGTRVQRPAG